MSEHLKKYSFIVFTHFQDANSRGPELYAEFKQDFVLDLYHNDSFPKDKKKKEAILEATLIKEKELLKSKSKELYYQIDEKTNEELKIFFENQNKEQKPKSKSNFYSLKNGLCYERGKGDTIIIYDETNSYKKISEIKIQIMDIRRVIGLPNKDIMIQNEEDIVIYRAKNNKYEILQKIKTDSEGYEQQYDIIWRGYTDRRQELRKYQFRKLEIISGNRFFLISNYGFKLYGLNEKNEYSLKSIILCNLDIKAFHEINENEFVIGSNMDIVDGILGPFHRNFLINILYIMPQKYELLIKNVYEFDTLDNDRYRYTINGECVLNNRYYICLIDYYLIIIDIVENKAKKYIICRDGEKTLYVYDDAKLQIKDDKNTEFLIKKNEQKTLFKIIGNELKIIGYYSGKYDKVDDEVDEEYDFELEQIKLELGV